MSELVFVAPLGRPLRHLHIVEEGGRVDDPAVLCLTRCGMPMVEHDLWTVVPRHRGDRLCYECAVGAGLVKDIPDIGVIPHHG